MEYKFNLPFYVGPTSKASEGGRTRPMEDILVPLQAKYCERYDYIRVTNVGEYKELLWKSYQDEAGNMASTPIGSSIISRARLEQFTHALSSTIASLKLHPRSAIDIGGGEGGFLLDVVSQYSLSSNNCAIIEPGPQADSLLSQSINVCKDFEEACLLDKKFDIAIASGVLEHVEEPVNFMKRVHQLMSVSSIGICTVPSLEQEVENKKISLSHQHIHYFSARSIQKILQEAGLVDILTTFSEAGNEIISVFCRGDNELSRHACSKKFEAIGRKEAEDALTQTHLKHEQFISISLEFINKGIGLGFHGGGVNEAAILQCRLGDNFNIRFFNNDTYVWGKSLLNTLPPVLDPSRAAELGVKVIVVFPEHYFHAIQSVYERQNINCVKYSDFIGLSAKEIYGLA